MVVVTEKTSDTANLTITSDVGLVVAVDDAAAVDVGDETEVYDLLGALGRDVHRAAAVDGAVGNIDATLNLLEERTACLPIVELVAATVEATGELRDGWELLALLHVDIGVEANDALLVLPSGETLALVCRLSKGEELLVVRYRFGLSDEDK